MKTLRENIKEVLNEGGTYDPASLTLELDRRGMLNEFMSEVDVAEELERIKS